MMEMHTYAWTESTSRLLDDVFCAKEKKKGRILNRRECYYFTICLQAMTDLRLWGKTIFQQKSNQQLAHA